MTEPTFSLCPGQDETLLAVARASIDHGLQSKNPLPVDPEDYAPELRAPRAVFVTLKSQGDLRGCVGTLEADLPLVVNVARFAFASAFSDTRFPPLTRAEVGGLAVQISVLTELEPILFDSEAELLGRIRPRVDGLLLEEGVNRGTLLPSVWEEIPDPREFLRRLKLKAGLPMDYWSDTVRVRRYRTTCVPAPPGSPTTSGLAKPRPGRDSQ
jgi:uncharacterized protein